MASSVPKLPPFVSAQPIPKYPGLELTKAGRKFHYENLRTQRLTIFTDKQLRNHEVHVVNGRLVAGKGEKKKPLNTHTNTCNRDLLFAMHPDGKIYVEYNVGTIHHTSLIGAHQPIAVGTMKTLEGRLIEITENSDQYAPAGRLLLVLRTLNDRGAVIDPALDPPSPRIDKEEKKTRT